MSNINEAYCPTCSKKVAPVKKTSWPLLIACAIFGGVIFGTIAYCLYEAVIKKADTCPNCKKKVMPIVQTPVVVAMPEPYCPNCGARNDPDTVHCVNCGREIARIAPKVVF